MVRISKQAERRQKSPRKHRAPKVPTGALKENLPEGYRIHQNALEGTNAKSAFIPKIR